MLNIDAFTSAYAVVLGDTFFVTIDGKDYEVSWNQRAWLNIEPGHDGFPGRIEACLYGIAALQHADATGDFSHLFQHVYESPEDEDGDTERETIGIDDVSDYRGWVDTGEVDYYSVDNGAVEESGRSALGDEYGDLPLGSNDQVTLVKLALEAME